MIVLDPAVYGFRFGGAQGATYVPSKKPTFPGLPCGVITASCPMPFWSASVLASSGPNIFSS